MGEFFDFFGEGEEDFYNKFKGVETVLIQGKHWDKEPLVTILLTTYKRCDLLEEALESALNQIGFDDYQIIVVDNEGKDIDVATDTAKLLCKYDNDKVIYYRHKQSVSFKMDNAVKLAKSKWIVFLHDDDILHPYHLKIMTEIAKKNSQAKYISCPIKDFVDGTSVINTKFKDKYQYSVYTKAKEEACLGYYTGWLGALIDRNAYISSGGMPTYCNNLGDFCMVQKIHYKFWIWELYGEAPLYFHRVWKGQASSLGTETWTDLYVAEYEYFLYVSKVYHPLTYKFWNRISAYRILDKAQHMNRGLYKYNINLQSLAEKAGMSFNSLYRNKQYKMDIAYRIIYEIFNDFLFTRERDRGVVKL